MASRNANPKKEPTTPEDLLVFMVAANGGAGPGAKAYKFFSEIDGKGHSMSSFKHAFRTIAAEARELLAAHPEVQPLLAAPSTPKKVSDPGRKRKGEEVEDGGDDAEEKTDVGETVAKKKRVTAKGKGKVIKAAESEENGGIKEEQEVDEGPPSALST